MDNSVCLQTGISWAYTILVLAKVLSLIFLFFFSVTTANAAADYRITNFNSDIQIRQNTQLHITETIEVNFTVPKHGIFREIPVIYRSPGKTIHSRLKVISVKDEFGKDYTYSIHGSGDAQQIKIGDPDSTLTGPHIYTISYTVENILQRFENHIELFWNVAGSNWDVPIDQANAVIHSPYAQVIRSECFTGRIGNTLSDCQISPSGDVWEVSTTDYIAPGHDLTLVFGLDTVNQLDFPSPESVFWKDEGLWIILEILPAIFFALAWFLHGRDYKFASDNVYFQEQGSLQALVPVFGREHLPLVYAPIEGLTPSEAGTILDLKVDLADLVAEISELARLKFIRIIKISKDRLLLPDKTDYLFVRDPKVPQISLKSHQQFLLDSLFAASYKAPISQLEKYLSKKEILDSDTALVSKMKGKFYTDLNEFRDKLYTNLTAEGFFTSRPDHVKIGGIVAAVVISAILMIFANANSLSQIIWPIGLASGLVAVIFGSRLGRRTAKGHAYYRQLVGLKYFVGKGKWRYEIHEKHLFLEEILPLAISLGVINKLSSDMKDLQLEPPKYMGNLAYADFGSFGSTVGKAMALTPSGSSGGWSGGSGFSGGSSGGGFGGGGGGSW